MKTLFLHNQQGIALVIVIWVLALLTAIAAEVGYSMRMEVNIVRNFKEATQAEYIAQAGLNHTILTLIHRGTNRGAGSDARSGTDPGPRLNSANAPRSFAGGLYTVQLDNAAGWINLNQSDPALLQLVMDGLQISGREKDAIIDSILDWRDSDDFHRLNGAEDDYYRSLPRPYHCKNGDFEAVEELRLVKGVTPEIFDRLRTMFIVLPGRTDDNSDIWAVQEQEAFGLAANKINVNAAPRHILAILPGLKPEQIDRILEFRTREDFMDYNALAQAIGAESLADVEPYITLALSPYYHIRVDGGLQGSPVVQTMDALVRLAPGTDRGYEIVRISEGL